MKTYSNKLHALFDDLGWLTLLVAASIIVSIIGFWHTQTALAAQLASDYCSQYATNDQKNACKDGLKGTNCQNYADAGFDTTVVDICKKAAADLAAGTVKPGDVKVPDTSSPTPSVAPSASPSTSPQSDATNVNMQNYLDQAKTLSNYIDLLHNAGTDSKTDTSKADDSQYGSYVNGAGKQQPIKTINAGTGKSPAILFINGGGWHANDCMGERVAAGGGDDCSASGGDGFKPSSRGYAMYDLTYRLGSSSVYYAFEDVMRGIKHMHDNASKYGIDPNKIVIWGDSAGGSLSMRAAASGKSGAKAAVGWSAPTNGYTGLFHSFQSFAIGMDHSTCIPTDLAGFTNFANLLNGGSGDVAQYGQGLSSNDFSSLGINTYETSFDSGGINPLALLTEGMIAGKNALSAGSDVEAISNQINSKNTSSLTASTFNLATKKFTECLNNFNALSPALFASPESAPSFLAGFYNDGVVGPDQLTGMRDKLRQLGIKSDSLILPGDDDCAQTAAGPAGSGGCHLGYYYKFVCETVKFIDSIVQPEKGVLDCGTNKVENAPSTGSGTGSSNSGGGAQTGQSDDGCGAYGHKTGGTCTCGPGSVQGKDGICKPGGCGQIDRSSAGTWYDTCTGGTSQCDVAVPAGAQCPPSWMKRCDDGTVIAPSLDCKTKPSGLNYTATNGTTDDNSWKDALAPAPGTNNSDSWYGFYTSLPKRS